MKKFSKSHVNIMILVSIIFYVYEFLLRILPGVLEHEYRELLFFSPSQIGLIDAAYYWAYTPMQPFVGAIVDHFGVRPSILLSIIMCAAGSFFMCSNDLTTIVLSRLVMGFGSAFAFISVLKLATEWLAPRNTNFVAGLTTALGKVFAFIGMTMMTQWVITFD
jgi:MFS family permease